VGEVHGQQGRGDVRWQPGHVEGERLAAGEPPAFEQDEPGVRRQVELAGHLGVADLLQAQDLTALLDALGLDAAQQ
jgi:hypothetical protein